jgi:hypothetical protein
VVRGDHSWIGFRGFAIGGWFFTSRVVVMCTALLSISNARADQSRNCKNEVFTVEVTECKDVATYPNLPRLEINGMNATPFLERFRDPLMVRRCFTRQQQELRCVPQTAPVDH